MRRPILHAFALLLLLPQLADAQQPDRTLARKYYKAGKQAYAAGEYETAAKEFSAGYLHDPKPAFLINIAQSQRKAGDLEQAAHYYREYLRKAPDSPLAPQVQGLIKEIDEEIERKEIEQQKKPPPTVMVAQPPAPPPPRPGPRPFYKKWWFWAGVGAVVVAGVGVGVYAGTRGPDYVESGGLGSVSW